MGMRIRWPTAAEDSQSKGFGPETRQKWNLLCVSAYPTLQELWCSGEENMRNQTQFAVWAVAVSVVVSVLAYGADQKKSVTVTTADGHHYTYALAEISRIDFKDGAVIVFKDGHEKSFSLAEVSRIEFSPASPSEAQFGRNHFLGKWKVGNGAGSHFYITLEADGQARKTIGANRGTWKVVDGEARISWDDGWHDVIRKAGSKHEKVAFAPGKNFDAEPDNITDAQNTNSEPL
jgi:hypothetical protein